MCALHLVKMGEKMTNFETAVCLVAIFVEESFNSETFLANVRPTVTVTPTAASQTHTRYKSVYRIYIYK